MSAPWLPGGTSVLALPGGEKWMKAINVATTSGGVMVWMGSAWVMKPMRVWMGSSWSAKPVRHWNGSIWALT